jgi:wyosine [tRNA(Phe)-imidazoG37] synthetase (radical SAM superfamily)
MDDKFHNILDGENRPVTEEQKKLIKDVINQYREVLKRLPDDRWDILKNEIQKIKKTEKVSQIDLMYVVNGINFNPYQKYDNIVELLDILNM